MNITKLKNLNRTALNSQQFKVPNFKMVDSPGIAHFLKNKFNFSNSHH